MALGKVAAGPQNKGMQLTRPVLVAASQLIPSVRPTVREQHEEVAPGMSTARGLSGADGAAAAPQR